MSPCGLIRNHSMENRQLVAFVFTSTHTSLSITTTTSTVPRICIFGPNTLATCTGRRRRKRHQEDSPAGQRSALPAATRSAPVLLPSVEPAGAATGPRAARFLAISFTSLVTVTSTTTSTTFTTNTSTTVSVSILCTAAGMNLETIYCASG
ncbi:uncharacterized protein LOC119103518 [Pollicipes pollicipes]|uniref:uncharacterized protein LOC119103518 n=1 Tax=Pollicipes pollicipes TaxID=41117 RepID=UPI001884B117|nr:uncharacterized protein LOC119103518 [Pollicipes pollicipes]